jgi:hypothetical protein
MNLVAQSANWRSENWLEVSRFRPMSEFGWKFVERDVRWWAQWRTCPWRTRMPNHFFFFVVYVKKVVSYLTMAALSQQMLVCFKRHCWYYQNAECRNKVTSSLSYGLPGRGVSERGLYPLESLRINDPICYLQGSSGKVIFMSVFLHSLLYANTMKENFQGPTLFLPSGLLMKQ